MLPKSLMDLMRNLWVFPAVLGTVDKEGNIHLTFITWVYPVDERTIRFALSSGAKSSKNIQQTGIASIMFFAQDMAFACYGSTQMVSDSIEEVKFHVSVFEMNIERAENNLFPGGTVIGTIPFAHTGNLINMVELDVTVIEAMKNL
ncbi:MAG: pyridoxamine 5'-phosphate oxidase family protein [Aquificaceae bacterium]